MYCSIVQKLVICVRVQKLAGGTGKGASAGPGQTGAGTGPTYSNFGKLPNQQQPPNTYDNLNVPKKAAPPPPPPATSKPILPGLRFSRLHLFASFLVSYEMAGGVVSSRVPLHTIGC